MSTLSKFHASKSHCINGHHLTPENIKRLTNQSGYRVCKICHRENSKRYREMKRKPPKTTEDRFWEKVRKTSKCWEWLGSKYPSGYGQFRYPPKGQYAHRYAYELLVAKIDSKLQIDHLCRNRGCVNPNHLEPVTCRVNVLRGEALSAKNAVKTHCKRGHEFTPENTYVQMQRGKPRRACHICKKKLMLDNYYRKAAINRTSL